MGWVAYGMTLYEYVLIDHAVRHARGLGLNKNFRQIGLKNMSRLEIS